MENKYNRKYFLGITRSGSDNGYDIYFVNDTEEMVTVSLESGSFATADDEVVTTSPVKLPGQKVDPKGYILIDTLDEFDLDFVTSYDLKIETSNGTEKLSFYQGKRIGFLGNFIPVINKMGKRLFSY